MLITTFQHVHKHSHYKRVLCQSRQAEDDQRSRLPNEQNLLCSRLLPSEQTLYSNACTPLNFHWQPVKRGLSPELCFSHYDNLHYGNAMFKQRKA